MAVIRTDFQKESVAAMDRVQWQAVLSDAADGGHEDEAGGAVELSAVEL